MNNPSLRMTRAMHRRVIMAGMALLVLSGCASTFADSCDPYYSAEGCPDYVASYDATLYVGNGYYDARHGCRGDPGANGLDSGYTGRHK